MVGRKKKLTALQVKSLKSPGVYFDSDGLYLNVSKAGSKCWIFRYMLNGKRRDMGLGSYKYVTLEQARIARNDQRKFLVQGVDPIDYKNAQKEAREKAKINSRFEDKQSLLESKLFKECAQELIAQKKPEWRNEKHIQQWENTLRDYVYPHIGCIKVGEVDIHLILKCLTPIWTTKNETTTRIRQRIETILDYAKVMGYREGGNPAVWKGNLEYVLPKPSKVKTVVHHKALSYDELPEFMKELSKMDGLSALALQLTILTATRTSEALKAESKEFDLENKIWTVPKERMKAGIKHRVALSSKTVKIIQSVIKFIEPIKGRGDLLFPGMKQGRPLSNLSMMQVLKRMKYTDITVHGFRSTFHC